MPTNDSAPQPDNSAETMFWRGSDAVPTRRGAPAVYVPRCAQRKQRYPRLRALRRGILVGKIVGLTMILLFMIARHGC